VEIPHFSELIRYYYDILSSIIAKYRLDSPLEHINNLNNEINFPVFDMLRPLFPLLFNYTVVHTTLGEKKGLACLFNPLSKPLQTRGEPPVLSNLHELNWHELYDWQSQILNNQCFKSLPHTYMILCREFNWLLQRDALPHHDL
jgi:hypothetical protein